MAGRYGNGDGTGGGWVTRVWTAAATADQLRTSTWMPSGACRCSGVAARMRSWASESVRGWTATTPRTSVQTGLGPSSPPPCSERNSETRASPAQCSGPIPALRQNASASSSSSTDGSPTRRATHCSSAANAVATNGADVPPGSECMMSHSTGRPFSECGVSAWLMRSGTR